MSVSSINTNTPASLLIPVTNTANTASTNASSPVVASSDPGLAAQASALSTTSGIVATLGSASTGTQVYDAAGLYNSIAQAGTSATVPATSTSTTGNNTSAAAAAASAQQSLNASVLSTLPGGSYSGFYNGSGVVQSTASAGGTNLTSNFASALQANPNLAHTVAADSFAQGIIGTLSTTA
ncbi:MAG: hypothetical protein JO002_11980 [Burkholderiaceae bacterium]|nr:hypothetical protein [Burkholderiaceae bacterium]